MASSEAWAVICPARVLFKPHSGRAFIKRLDSDVGANVAKEELALAKRRVVVPAPVDDIELFLGGPT